MDNPIQFDRQDPLAKRLRREARRSRPEFSAGLHARLQAAALRAAAVAPHDALRSRRGRYGSRSLWIISAAAAIALLVGTARIELNLGRRPGNPHSASELAQAEPIVPRLVNSEPHNAAAINPVPIDPKSNNPIPVNAMPITPAPTGRTPTDPAKPAVDDIDSTLELVSHTASGLQKWIATTLDENQWAGLDRDAKSAMEAVAGAVPFDLSAAIAESNPAR
jgi:hypothetical protein